MLKLDLQLFGGRGSGSGGGGSSGFGMDQQPGSPDTLKGALGAKGRPMSDTKQ